MLALVVREKPRQAHLRSTLLLGVCVLLAVVSTRWLRVNLSPSVPRGLYRLTAVPTPLPRGTLVVLPVPARVHPWHSAWRPLLKPVAAVAGETVCVKDEELWVGEQYYGAVWRQANGHALPALSGCLTVQPGEVFVASTVPKSLDGRYLGVTSITALTAQAIPVLTWR